MAEAILVRPTDEIIDGNFVALWDNDPAHIEVNSDWEEFGGAYIVGNPDDPEKTYKVANTPYVQTAISQKRLVQIRLVKPGSKPAKGADKEPETPPQE